MTEKICISLNLYVSVLTEFYLCQYRRTDLYKFKFNMFLCLPNSASVFDPVPLHLPLRCPISQMVP